jgi:hypothetical protein
MKFAKRSHLWIAALGSLLACASSSAQPPCELTLQFNVVPVQSLSISDVDFDHFESTRLLFTARIGNPSGRVISAQLHLVLDIHLVDGTDYTPAVTFTTRPFDVPAGGRTVTNLDLGRNADDIQTESFDFNSSARDRVEEAALGTAEFPAGQYRLFMELTDLRCGSVVGSDDEVLVLQNPSRVELRSPRDGEVTNTFPFFEWYYDGGGPVVVTVARQDSGQSREDAITRVPPMLQVELRGQSSLLYAGGRPLEYGGTYVWSVAAKSLATGGSSSVNAPIGTFTVGAADNFSGGGGGGALSDDDAFLAQLESLLGPRYKSVFQQIRNGNFKTTGKLTGNGTPVTREALLNAIREALESNSDIDAAFE